MDISPINMQFADIRLMNRLGEGGMSSVWKAMDLKRKEVVAVKILNKDFSSRPEDVEQFMAEEKVMEAIEHPGIVKGYELRHSGPVWYYIMEYVDGYNFGALLRRKQHLKEVDCLLICESISSALDYAWNNFGVVHCDIKPENIMINTDGEVKLTDLGLCHVFRHFKDEGRDVPDHILGTPAYISPEQVYGDVEPDCRVDVYSLAATLYHLATGRVLFPGLDSDETMRAHCGAESQAKDPRVYRPELSEGFCQMLEAMLVKDRDGRPSLWSDVLAMCQDVERGVAFKPRRTPGVSSLALFPARN